MFGQSALNESCFIMNGCASCADAYITAILYSFLNDAVAVFAVKYSADDRLSVLN